MRANSVVTPVLGAFALSAVTASALVSAAPEAARAAAEPEPETCPDMITLDGGDFETPEVVSQNNWQLFDQTEVPGWSTTASDGQIELQENGFNDSEAQSGRQWAELNATEVASLYQDLETAPGVTMGWSLYHRGKDGEDVMTVSIGEPGDDLEVQAVIADGPDAWGYYTGTYTIPEGQTQTRFSFDAVSSSSGRPNLGNQLDDVSFAVESCVQLDKSVENLSRSAGVARVGDTLKYTAVATNHGGSPAEDLVVTDAIPAGAEFVPGSLAVAGAAQTAAVGDDLAEYESGEATFRIGVGADAETGGRLDSEESASLSFEVVVVDARLIENVATAAYRDSVTDGEKSARSRTVETPTEPVADAAALPATGGSRVPTGTTAAGLLLAGAAAIAVSTRFAKRS